MLIVARAALQRRARGVLRDEGQIPAARARLGSSSNEINELALTKP